MPARSTSALSGSYVFGAPFIPAIDTNGISVTAADPTLAAAWPTARSATTLFAALEVATGADHG